MIRLMNTNTLFITIYLLLYPVIVQSTTETSFDTLSVEKEKQIKGEIIVTLPTAIPAAKRFNLFKLLQITKNSLRRKL